MGLPGPRSRFLSHLRRFLLSSMSPRHPSDVTTFFVLACVLTGLATELCPSASPTRRVSLLPSRRDTPASLRLQICHPESFPKTIHSWNILDIFTWSSWMEFSGSVHLDGKKSYHYFSLSAFCMCVCVCTCVVENM